MDNEIQTIELEKFKKLLLKFKKNIERLDSPIVSDLQMQISELLDNFQFVSDERKRIILITNELKRSTKIAQREFIIIQKRLETRMEGLTVLYDLEKAISTTKKLDELLDVITIETARIIGAQDCTIFLLKEETAELYVRTTQSDKKEVVKNIRVKLGEGIVGWVTKYGEPAIVNDVTKDSRWKGTISKDIDFPTTSILCVPMVVGEKIIGAIELINKIKRGTFFTNDDVQLLAILAAQAAKAIETTRLIEENQKAERLATVGQMASSIIHDIKNPMSIIKGFADMLGRKAPENKRYTDRIISAVDRLVSTTQEILDYSRGDTKLIFTETTIKNFIEEIVNLLEMDFKEHNIELDVKLGYTDSIIMDTIKMHRVFINIASNSRDAMPNGGKFTITNHKILGRHIFTLSDTGCGMPLEIKEKIFEPFITYGKPNGTGLGMAICHSIITSHNGIISLESEEHLGTTFRIELPDDLTKTPLLFSSQISKS